MEKIACPEKGKDTKRVALKTGEDVDPGCEDAHPPGGACRDSRDDAGDSDVIAGLSIPEGCFRTGPGRRKIRMTSSSQCKSESAVSGPGAGGV